jgi:hypothetical protein
MAKPLHVAVADGNARVSFAAVQSRALSRLRRARGLADQHPAMPVISDILTHPVVGLPGLQPHPYVERRILWG